MSAFDGDDCFGLAVVEAQRLEVQAVPERSGAPMSSPIWREGEETTSSADSARSS